MVQLNFLRKRRLGRRTILKGAGTTLSLPFLESMLPAASSLSKIPPPMACFYFGTGMNMRVFEPKEEGKGYSLTPTLEPLAKYKEKFTVLSGTYLEYGGGHTGDYTFLTGVQTHNGGRIQNAISCDQFVANEVGGGTRFPSLQMSVKRGTGFGGQALGTLSWNKNGIPLASESDPHRIFRRLFQEDSPDEAEARQAGFRLRGSILDSVIAQAKSLEPSVSSLDKQKLDEYFSSVREVEQQLQRNRQWADKPKPKVDLFGYQDYSEPCGPEDVNASEFNYFGYSRMMYDLIALAFQTDSTRVASYVVRRELAGGIYPEFGISEDFHTLTHHNNDPRKLADLAKADRIYMERWAEFLARMESIKEVDGSSLLDHTMLGFSSGMGIGHSKDRLPTVLCGGTARGIRHQGHLKLPTNTPLASVWHTMAHKMGAIAPDAPFQDSKGAISELLA
jgi:hypothetical protein